MTRFNFFLLLISGIFILEISAGETLVLKNEIIRKEITTPETPAAILVKSFSSGDKSIIQDEQTPWFEFSVNGDILKATDPIWVFDELKTREMLNGGTEYKLHYICRKEGLQGLKITIYQQIFPNSTLTREKLEITNTRNNPVKLTKVNGKLHFYFPTYAIPFSNPEVYEIRIGTWSKDQLEFNDNKTYDDRIFEGNPHHSLATCWMFHPVHNKFNLTADPLITKGPINIIMNDYKGWITTYEHASQDTRSGLEQVEMTLGREGFSIDEHQDVDGVFHFTKTDEHMHFIGVKQNKLDDHTRVSVTLLRGGYLDGEAITSVNPYSTVWMATAYFENDNPLNIVKEYLLNQICEYPESRKIEFYYNTWGMQRDYSSKGKPIRGVFTEERILQEIEYASQLNVDLFVLDDGWQEHHGEWKPNKERLPNGLTPIKEALDRHGIKMGVWINPTIANSDTRVFKEHPEWIIRDANGEPLLAQWQNPAVDIVGPYYYWILEECKWLIDQGVRFFKFDAINEYNSYLPGLWHGNKTHSIEERISRYDYLLPMVITRLMEELVQYEPELVIEMDVTEARRSMIGLAPLSYGKLFWMNNGASAYGDYSHYRAKSMRTIPNIYEPYIPLVLFTYANYPHNRFPFFAQRYNVNTSLIAGNGFWGNLDLLTDEQRLRVGKTVAKSKKVLPYLVGDYTTVKGKIGGAPEIYTQFNPVKGAGQVIAFSSRILTREHKVPLGDVTVLGVLNHSFDIEEDTLILAFEFNMPDDTREAFILPVTDNKIRMTSSTCWIDDIYLDSNALHYVSGGEGLQTILWCESLGEPRVNVNIHYSITKKDDIFIIKINSSAGEKISIQASS